VRISASANIQRHGGIPAERQDKFPGQEYSDAHTWGLPKEVFMPCSGTIPGVTSRMQT
jgi:hypothetical protein